RLSRDVRSEGEGDARVEERAVGIGTQRAIAPKEDGILVRILQRRRLGGYEYSELAQPGDISRPDELGMLYPNAEFLELAMAREDFLVGVEEDRDAPVPYYMEGSLPPPPRQELELGEGRRGVGAELFLGGIRERLEEAGVA